MDSEILAVQTAVSENFDWLFMKDREGALETAHYATLTKQLKAVLLEVRTIRVGIEPDHNVSVLKACPHCGIVWNKVSGCDGVTFCGTDYVDVSPRTSFARFSFSFDEKASSDGVLTFTQTPEAFRPGTLHVPGSYRIGCGGKIDWSLCTPVPVPPELSAAGIVSVADIQHIKPGIARTNWETFFAELAKTSIPKQVDLKSVVDCCGNCYVSVKASDTQCHKCLHKFNS